MPVPVAAWPLIVESRPTPWPAEVIHADLVWWSDRASPERPPFSALGARWGVSKSTARRLVVAFDTVNRGEPLVNRSWTDGEPITADATPHIEAKRTAREPLVNRSWTDGEPVPTENDGNPMVFEALQKQKTEAEDRSLSVLEASSSEVTVVPLEQAAPPALCPAGTDPEPDWDALFARVPLTYDEESDDGEALRDGDAPAWTAGGMGAEAMEAGDEARPPAAAARPVAVGGDGLGSADGLAVSDGEADDGGRLGASAGDVGVEAVLPQRGGAERPESVAGGVVGGGSARRARVDELRASVPSDGVLTGDGCLPLASATQAPPATRKPRPAPEGDVETLWAAWRAHGTVRGAPNPKRRRLLERAIDEHGLAAMTDLLDAAHTGDGGYWRHLQGATERNDTAYLSPETLLNGRLADRIDRAAEWVEAGRPRHRVEETRREARAEAAARPALERAREAWPYAVRLIGSAPGALDKLVATWPEANARALRDGLRACGGLSALGRADQYRMPELRRKFLAGVVQALGGSVTDAELMREVG
jgi:hypothetical protein